MRGISTVEEANQFLPRFIEDYNRRFGKEPRDLEDAHRPLRKEDNLERLFARRSTRKISKDLSFQYEGSYYQIQPTLKNRFRPTHVNILAREGKPILVESEGREYAYAQWGTSAAAKPRILDSKELEAHWPSQSRKRPGRYHPWR